MIQTMKVLMDGMEERTDGKFHRYEGSGYIFPYLLREFCCTADTLEIQTQELWKEEGTLTREENLFYRRNCPYDAMGDYSILMEENQDRTKIRKKSGTGQNQQKIRSGSIGKYINTEVIWRQKEFRAPLKTGVPETFCCLCLDSCALPSGRP